MAFKQKTTASLQHPNETGSDLHQKHQLKLQKLLSDARQSATKVLENRYGQNHHYRKSDFSSVNPLSVMRSTATGNSSVSQWPVLRSQDRIQPASQLMSLRKDSELQPSSGARVTFFPAKRYQAQYSRKSVSTASTKQPLSNSQRLLKNILDLDKKRAYSLSSVNQVFEKSKRKGKASQRKFSIPINPKNQFQMQSSAYDPMRTNYTIPTKQDLSTTSDIDGHQNQLPMAAKKDQFHFTQPNFNKSPQVPHQDEHLKDSTHNLYDRSYEDNRHLNNSSMGLRNNNSYDLAIQEQPGPPFRLGQDAIRRNSIEGVPTRNHIPVYEAPKQSRRRFMRQQRSSVDYSADLQDPYQSNESLGLIQPMKLGKKVSARHGDSIFESSMFKKRSNTLKEQVTKERSQFKSIEQERQQVFDKLCAVNKSAFPKKHSPIMASQKQTSRNSSDTSARQIIADGKIQVKQEDKFALVTSPRSSSRSNRGGDDMKTVSTGKAAPSFVKFYKYEELKERLSLQNKKDKKRSKLKQKLKEQDQYDTNTLDVNFNLDPDLIHNLSKVEESTLYARKTMPLNNKSGLHRLRNIAMRDKIDRFLHMPAVYMAPHKNKVAKDALTGRKNFKPKVMIGDLRKPNCEFTSDLVIIAHSTRLVKKRVNEDRIAQSQSLQQMRLKDRLRRKHQVMIKEEHDDLSQQSQYSFNSEDSQIKEDIQQHQKNKAYFKKIEELENDYQRTAVISGNKLTYIQNKLSKAGKTLFSKHVAELSEEDSEDVQDAIYGGQDSDEQSSEVISLNSAVGRAYTKENKQLMLDLAQQSREDMQQHYGNVAKNPDWKK